MRAHNLKRGFCRKELSLASLVLAGLLPLLGLAQVDEDIKEVSPADLLQQPQAYWAVPVVFKDTLTELPRGTAVKIAGERYIRFGTATLSDCYVNPQLVPRLEVQELNRPYLFIATVLQQSRTFGRSRYYITVTDFQPATLAPDEVPGSLEDLLASPSGSMDPGLLRVRELAEEAEQAIFAYRKENDLVDVPILGADAPQARKVRNIISQIVGETERENTTTSRDLLADYIRALLAAKEDGAIEAKPPVAPMVESETADDPVMPIHFDEPVAPPPDGPEATEDDDDPEAPISWENDEDIEAPAVETKAAAPMQLKFSPLRPKAAPETLEVKEPAPAEVVPIDEDEALFMGMEELEPEEAPAEVVPIDEDEALFMELEELEPEEVPAEVVPIDEDEALFKELEELEPEEVPAEVVPIDEDETLFMELEELEPEEAPIEATLEEFDDLDAPIGR